VVKGDVGKSQSRVSRHGNTSMRDPELAWLLDSTSVLNALPAVWLIIAPWLLGSPTEPFGLDMIVTGAVVLAVASVRLNVRKTALVD
jgi:hypothetical protein